MEFQYRNSSVDPLEKISFFIRKMPGWAGFSSGSPFRMRSRAMLLSFSLLSVCSHSAQAVCAAASEPRVIVIPRKVNLTWDYSQSGAELTAFLNNGRTEPTMGLTTIQMDYSHDIHLSADLCQGPSVQVHLSTKTATVAIAKELSTKDCYYRQVVAHEMKHVKSAQRAVDDSAKTLKKRLVAALKAASDTAAAADKYTAHSIYAGIVESEIQAAMIAGTEQFSREGAAIDSEEESARFMAACTPKTMLAARQKSSRSRIRP